MASTDEEMPWDHSAGVDWFRVILDEAHRIKARSSSTCYAANALQARTRWCLSGTPLQNRLGDLYSMLRFLRWDPWAFYMCSAKHGGGVSVEASPSPATAPAPDSGNTKDASRCPCRRTTFDFGAGNRKCPECGHAPMRHYSYFNRCVLTPIQRYGYRGMGRLAYRTLRGHVLAKGVLRRTKAQRQAELQLPIKQVVIRSDAPSAQELDFYNSLYHKSHAKFSTYVASGTLLHNYAHVFDLLSSLRQACNHPYLVLLSKNVNTSSPLNASAAMQAPHIGSLHGSMPRCCCICNASFGLPEDKREETANSSFLDASGPVISKCGHYFHRRCVDRHLASPDAAVPESGVGSSEPGSTDGYAHGTEKDGRADAQESKCPACGDALSVDLRAKPSGFRVRNRGVGARKSLLGKISAQQLPTSTKLEAVADEVRKMMALNSSKAVIFSQYTRMLDLVTIRLSADDVGVARISGDMTRQQRDENLKAFREDRHTRVIMISLS